MKLSSSIFLHDLYLVFLVFARHVAVGLGFGVGVFFTALLWGFLRSK